MHISSLCSKLRNEETEFLINHSQTLSLEPEIPPFGCHITALILRSDMVFGSPTCRHKTKEKKTQRNKILSITEEIGPANPIHVWAGNVSSGTLRGIQTQFIQLLSCLLTQVLSLHKKEELLPPTFYCLSLGCGEPIRLASHCFCYSPLLMHAE